MRATLTYIGGPTAVIELAGIRLITDPTFDPAGTEYPTAAYTLRKTIAPAVAAEAIGRLDAVLLSHDHHADNLDHRGRAMLDDAPIVLTTREGAVRLGGNAIGLSAGETHTVDNSDGRSLKIVATAARHGPAGGDRGPVIGFLLSVPDPDVPAIYVSGDTVWYEGVANVARTSRVGMALLFMGAAHVAAAGPSHLTFTATEAAAAAQAFDEAIVVPLHYEGWEHFAESRADVDSAFTGLGLMPRLAWLEPGIPRAFELGTHAHTAQARPGAREAVI